MKAVVKQSEKPDDFAFTEVSIPEINNDEMLVRVKAIGVGIHDGYFFPQDIQYPYIIGIEAAGVVEEIGENISNYQVGDKVAFISLMQTKGGTWAEYAVVSEDSIVIPIPESMRFEEASAVLVAGNTALKILHASELEDNDSLFIAGGAGAIGTFLIQIAKARGYQVASSASEQNHEYVRSLGADMVVDYHDSDWKEQIKKWRPEGVDVAVGIHPGTPEESMGIVKNGGRIVAVSGDQFSPERDISVVQIFNTIDVKDELFDLMRSIATGKIKLIIEKTYPFEKVLAALEKVSTRHNRGKIVIKAE